RRKSSSATMSPLLTYQEAADYLRVSPATIDRLVRAAEISSVLIPGEDCFAFPTWRSTSKPIVCRRASENVVQTLEQSLARCSDCGSPADTGRGQHACDLAGSADIRSR